MKRCLEVFWCWLEHVGQKISRKPTEPHLNAFKNLVEVIVTYFAYVSELQCAVVIITALQKPLYLQLPDATGKGRDELLIEEKHGGEACVR